MKFHFILFVNASSRFRLYVRFVVLEDAKKFPGLRALARTAEVRKIAKIAIFSKIIKKKSKKTRFFPCKRLFFRKMQKKMPKKIGNFIVGSIPLGRGLQLLH